MKQVHIISQLFLQKGILKSRVDGSAKKVHYRQGELDGACGAYSIAMALNIIGAFDADNFTKETKDVDLRTTDGKLYKAIHKWGLYPDGLESEDCIGILESYGKYVTYESFEGIDKIKDYLDSDMPVIMSIQYPGMGHWIVVVGYEMKNGKVENIYTLDPSSALPISSYWNGVISLKKKKGKRYCYDYSSVDWATEVWISDTIALRKNKL